MANYVTCRVIQKFPFLWLDSTIQYVFSTSRKSSGPSYNGSVFLYSHYTSYVNSYIKQEKQADINYAKDHKHALIGSNSKHLLFITNTQIFEHFLTHTHYWLEFLVQTHPASVQYPNIRHHTKTRSLALQHSLLGGGSLEAHPRLLLWLGGLREASELGNSLGRQGAMKRRSRRRKANPRWMSTIQCRVLSRYLGRGKGTKVKLLAPFRLDSWWPCGGERCRRAQIHPYFNTMDSRGWLFNLRVVSKIWLKNCNHLLRVYICRFKYFVYTSRRNKQKPHTQIRFCFFMKIAQNMTQIKQAQKLVLLVETFWCFDTF